MNRMYTVSYDLLKPNQNYDGLISRLNALGAVRVQLSQWIVRLSSGDAVALRDDLMRFIDSNDRLLVAGLTGEAAWSNLMASPNSVKQALAS